MRILIQRVREAKVSVEGEVVGEIGAGALIFLGIHQNDTPELAQQLAHKCAHLRFFHDENKKMNLDIRQVEGEVLVVSQFTLYANCNNGRRPDFVDAAPPSIAIPLYEKFVNELECHLRKPVPTGVFGAYMQVSLINDGPVTLLLERTES